MINSANRIASLVSKNDGNSSQYLLKASCAISPLWWSLHNPARKKCAKVFDYFMASGIFEPRTPSLTYFWHHISKVFHCMLWGLLLQIFFLLLEFDAVELPLMLLLLYWSYCKRHVTYFKTKLLRGFGFNVKHMVDPGWSIINLITLFLIISSIP